MIKVVWLLALFWATAVLAQSPSGSNVMGWAAEGNSSSVLYGTTLNAAATRSCQCFVVPSAKTLSATRTYTATKTGTLAATDIVMEIFDANSTGRPTGACGSAVASSSTVASSISSGTWTRHTGFTYSLTAGNQYCACLKNANGTPASNNITTALLRQGFNASRAGGSGTTAGWYNIRSTDTCSTFDQAFESSTFIMLEFDDSTYHGTPVYAGQLPDTPSDARVYSTYEVGNWVTTASTEKRKVNGITCYAGKVGTPTGSLRYRLYEGLTLVRTSGETPVGRVSNNKYTPGYFAAYELKPSTVYRFVASETTQSDTSSNSYSLLKLQTEDSANVRATMPFGGLKKTVSTDGGVSFSETGGDFISCALILDQSDELGAASGGSNKSSGINGGFN